MRIRLSAAGRGYWADGSNRVPWGCTLLPNSFVCPPSLLPNSFVCPPSLRRPFHSLFKIRAKGPKVVRHILRRGRHDRRHAFKTKDPLAAGSAHSPQCLTGGPYSPIAPTAKPKAPSPQRQSLICHECASAEPPLLLPPPSGDVREEIRSHLLCHGAILSCC